MRRPGAQQRPETEIADADDTLIMSVKLRSGRFESSIEVPLYATDDERKEFIEQWLNLMGAGIRCGQQHRASRTAMGRE